MVGGGLPALRRRDCSAARRALEASNLGADQLDVLIYGGVCREHFEPATACRVAALLGVGPETVDL